MIKVEANMYSERHKRSELPLRMFESRPKMNGNYVSLFILSLPLPLFHANIRLGFSRAD